MTDNAADALLLGQLCNRLDLIAGWLEAGIWPVFQYDRSRGGADLRLAVAALRKRYLSREAPRDTPPREPTAWMVTRDYHHEHPSFGRAEFFTSEEAATDNACLGTVDAHVTPLYAAPAAVEPREIGERHPYCGTKEECWTCYLPREHPIHWPPLAAPAEAPRNLAERYAHLPDFPKPSRPGGANGERRWRMDHVQQWMEKKR